MTLYGNHIWDPMIRVAPSILSADFSKLGEEIRAIEDGGADLVHIDVMDGNFVPNITIGPVVVESIRPLTKMPFDVHLMVRKPQDYVEDFINAGADILTVHVESDHNPHETIKHIHDLGKQAGVVLNPGTPLSVAEGFINEIEMVLIMTVNPGFGGPGGGRGDNIGERQPGRLRRGEYLGCRFLCFQRKSQGEDSESEGRLLGIESIPLLC